jgi:hypothetical protein
MGWATTHAHPLVSISSIFFFYIRVNQISINP